MLSAGPLLRHSCAPTQESMPLADGPPTAARPRRGPPLLSGLLPHGDPCITRRGGSRSRPMGVQRAKPLCRGRGGVPHAKTLRAGGREEQRSSRRVTQGSRLRGRVERGPRPARRDIRPFPSRPLASYTIPMAQLRRAPRPPVVRPRPAGEMRPMRPFWKSRRPAYRPRPQRRMAHNGSKCLTFRKNLSAPARKSMKSTSERPAPFRPILCLLHTLHTPLP